MWVYIIEFIDDLCKSYVVLPLLCKTNVVFLVCISAQLIQLLCDRIAE